MARILIIEDEQLASDKLSMLLRRIRPDFEILDTLATVAESIRWLASNSADLIFLDVNLADGISFGIFEHIQVSTPIIFTTAYDQYAIKAFRQNSLDYILKPVTEEELKAALEKFDRYTNRVTAKEQIADQSEHLSQLLKTFLGSEQLPKQTRNRILIGSGDRIKSLPIADVAYAYAFEKGVYVCTFAGGNFLVSDTMDQLEETLDSSRFYRVNRKFLVNINAIDEIQRYSTRRLKLDLQPPAKFDVLVPAEKITDFKNWLNR